MCSFKLIYLIIFLVNIYRTNCLISDKRLCINEDCSEPVSLAKTLLRYSSPEPLILSFSINANIKIFSKEAGSRTDLWGAEINGKRGYVPKKYVREYKIIGKPTIVVDTELSKNPEVPVEKQLQGKVNPDKVKEPFEVVDGTTIHLEADAINPSSTESPVLSTASSSINSQRTPSNSEAKGAERTAEIQGNVNANLAQPTQENEETAADSVVSDVFSSIKSWINEAPEDDEDGDEDDEGDEEEEGEYVDEESEEAQDLSTGRLTDNLKKEHTVSEKNENERIVTKEENASNSKIQSNEQLVNKKPEETVEKLAEEINDSIENEVVEDALNNNEQGKESSLNNSIHLFARNKEVEPIKTEENELTNSTETVNAEKKVEENESNNAADVKEAIIQTVTEGIKTGQQSNPIEAEATTETITEEVIEATTLPSVDHGEALPFLGTETVTPNPMKPPQELKSQGKIFSPVVASLFDKKPDSINLVKPGTQENISLENKSLNNPENALDSPQPFETKFQKIAENADSSAVEDSEDLKDVSTSENNAAESSQFSVGSNEVEADSKNVVSSEIVEDAKPELLFQHDPPLEESQQLSETTSSNSWYDNANTNTETPPDINSSENTSSSSENTETLNNIDQQNPDIPSDIHVNYLKNNEGLLPNNLLGENQDDGVLIEETVLEESGGTLSGLFALFGGGGEAEKKTIDSPSTPIGNADQILEENIQHPVYKTNEDGYCSSNQENCDKLEDSNILDKLVFLMNSDILLYLGTTAISCIIFLFIYMIIDKSSREAPLVGKINKLEKELLVTLKEKDMLQDGASSVSQVSTEEMNVLRRKLEEHEIVKQNLEMQVLSLQKEVEDKQGLEDQIESLEKELETSTEVGMELNRIISEMLDPNNGGEKLKENVEQLQRQLSEQKWIISDISKSLNEKEAENAELQAHLDRSKKKSTELQRKLDEIVDQILKIEKEKDQQQKSLQEEISMYQQKFSDEMIKKEKLNNDIQILKSQFADAQRKAELKIKEYQSLKDSLNDIQFVKNDKAALKSLLDATSVKAELEQLKSENERYSMQVKREEDAKIAFERKYQAVIEENNSLLKNYQQSDREKVEATMKLEVLNNYFKKREEELQGEILKYKSIWDAKEGEATSTTERMKLMAEEIENYKSQNETLKQEIVSQEIDLKSQISMLEKKVHENWVTSRQMERKLEDTRQEAAQLRNRLTLRERAMIDERTQNRLQSPLDQNGELPLSPPPIESPASPPMLFGGRDHITKSPALPGLPPFLPPPPGPPFMPLHGMPFMPPPPSMFPGDHRPPPLGRMSSPPPLNSRYSPDASAFSPYDRNTPSPPYDSEYGASPPSMRGYSPYSSRDDRRDYKRPMHISNGRNNKGSLMSSGSEHSNDSLDKVNRKHSKMV